jgi:hypothetical protein
MDQQLPLQDPPKFTQIWIFGLKTSHLATLTETLAEDDIVMESSLRVNAGKKVGRNVVKFRRVGKTILSYKWFHTFLRSYYVSSSSYINQNETCRFFVKYSISVIVLKLTQYRYLGTYI